MRILRFNETSNNNIIKTALFVTNIGSGNYQLCGTVHAEELEKAKVVENTGFKNMSFTIAKSLKEVDQYEDSDNIVWLNNWGHLMMKSNESYYVTIPTHEFDKYYYLSEKTYSDYKLEMLPYFIADSNVASNALVIGFFERLLNNVLLAWVDVNISEVIEYFKNCSVYGAYDKLKKILTTKYKFVEYFDDISEEEKVKLKDLDKMGFDD
jgi:hypothetical protein